MTIICTGSIAYDYLMSFPGYFHEHILPDHLEKISVSFLVDSMVRQRGGTAPNIAYSLALLGEHPILMGTAGEDFADYEAWLKSKGVDTGCVKIVEGMFTASFFANSDRANAQICSFYAGAMSRAGELSVLAVQPRPDLVIISPNDPFAMDRYVRECAEHGILYLYDPGQQVVRSDPSELRRGVENAYSVFVNEYEFELLQKHTGMSVSDIVGRVNHLVVTLGEQGAAIYTGGQVYETPIAPPGQILDPTGVGDAFRAGFVRAWRLGLGWELCGRVGALAASYCLETRGPQEHTYTINEFVARYRQYFDDHGALDVLLSV
jgi:adenosine kinase